VASWPGRGQRSGGGDCTAAIGQWWPGGGPWVVGRRWPSGADRATQRGDVGRRVAGRWPSGGWPGGRARRWCRRPSERQGGGGGGVCV
jgi:hypothetical protein